MSQSVILILGIVIGCVVTVCIWNVVSFIRNRGAYHTDDHKEHIMSSVEEKWVEIDDIMLSYRHGRIDDASFRASLAEKIEAINRIYKPALHLLDIFFVKYTEKLLEEHQRIVESPKDAIRPPEAPKGAVSEAPPGISRKTAAYQPGPIEAPRVAALRPAPIEFPRGTVMRPSPFEAPRMTATIRPAPVEPPPRPSIVPREAPSVSAAAFDEKRSSTQAPEAETISDRAPEIKASGIPSLKDPEVLTEKNIGDETIEKFAMESFEIVPLEVEEPSFVEIGTQKSEDELPLETFLEMEPGTGSVDKGIELRVGSEDREMIFEPKMTTGESQEEKTIPTEEPRDIMLPAPKPAAASQRSPSAFGSEEITQPATIFDVEAETIIADRNTIFPTHSAPAGSEEEKKTLEITGEDVIDTFDKYFGIKR